MQQFNIKFLIVLFLVNIKWIVAQERDQRLIDKVNVFLGSSGDHGQLSPAASYPFSALSIAPQTYPSTHTGYEYLAKEVLGFTHNRFEGVGCQGSGGLLLMKPFLGTKDDGLPLIKASEYAHPSTYAISFTNGLKADFTINKQAGLHHYQFPVGEKGMHINFAHSFNKAFVDESHKISGNTITGWIAAKTTCHVGTYRLYYHIRLLTDVTWKQVSEHEVMVLFPTDQKACYLLIGTSSVDEEHAAMNAREIEISSFRDESENTWESLLGQIKVKGDIKRESLFYSLLYRTIQSPYQISEKDGSYRAVDGKIYHTKKPKYHGWAIWDNYKTQLPLLSIAYPTRYSDIVHSIANLYLYGKKDFAGATEPTNTVRTEHAMVVLFDAAKKGYDVDFESIKDSLLAEANRLDHTKPDRALESAYDLWALAGIEKLMGNEILSNEFREKAVKYKDRWDADFKDLTKGDVDRMSARGMYQGTIRQYRWAVPFDVAGLVTLAGGREAFTQQLDDFFDHHYFNRANEPDMQAQMLYYASAKPWRYQQMVHQLAVDTVIQYYFNDNSRGIGAHIDRIYKNEPKAYIRTMDDDAGAMSAWFVLAAIGLHQACVGQPVYYLNVPLFQQVELRGGKHPFRIRVENFGPKNYYIEKVTLNGNDIGKLWISHADLQAGGELIIKASSIPQNYGKDNHWISAV